MQSPAYLSAGVLYTPALVFPYSLLSFREYWSSRKPIPPPRGRDAVSKTAETVSARRLPPRPRRLMCGGVCLFRLPFLLRSEISAFGVRPPFLLRPKTTFDGLANFLRPRIEGS